MSWKKKFLYSCELPKDFPLDKQAELCVLTNAIIAESNEFTIVHDRKLRFFAARHVHPAKKFRMRAYAQAKKRIHLADEKIIRAWLKNLSLDRLLVPPPNWGYLW